MWKSVLAVCGLVLAALPPSLAFAHGSAEDLAARCVARIEEVVTRAERAAADETQECVRTINALQEAGRDEAAAQVADECIRAATRRAREAAQLVTRLSSVCVEQLVALGEVELARRVHSAGEDAITDLRELLQREKRAIDAALDD
jgi:hypothetical protein